MGTVADTQVWGIRNIKTQEMWKTRRGKATWSRQGSAKGAWSNQMGGWCNPRNLIEAGITPILNKRGYPDNYRFDDQDVYEVFRIETINEGNLAEALGLLHKIVCIDPKIHCKREVLALLIKNKIITEDQANEN